MNKKKIIIVIVLCIIICITPIIIPSVRNKLFRFDYSKIKIGEMKLPDNYNGKLVWQKLTLKIYFDENVGEYLLIDYSSGVISGIIVINENRELVYRKNANVIYFDENKPLSYGEPFTNTCRGERCYVYITVDGRLVTIIGDDYFIEDILDVENWEKY